MRFQQNTIYNTMVVSKGNWTEVKCGDKVQATDCKAKDSDGTETNV